MYVCMLIKNLSKKFNLITTYDNVTYYHVI